MNGEKEEEPPGLCLTCVLKDNVAAMRRVELGMGLRLGLWLGSGVG